MSRRKAHLTNLEITKVALVDVGANPEADVLLFKAKYSADQLRSMAANGQAMPDESYPIGDREDLANAIRAVGRGSGSHDAIRRHIIGRARALGASDMIPSNWSPSGSMSKSKESDMPEPTVEDLAKQVAALTADRDAKAAELDALAKMDKADLAALVGLSVPTPAEDDVLKSLPAEVRKRITDAEESARRSAERVAKMEHAARHASFVAKAAEFDHLSASADELGDVLHEVADKVDEETFKSLDRILKAANAAAAELFVERGRAGTVTFGGAGPEAQLHAIAVELRKADPTLSEAQAIAKAADANPDLAFQVSRG